MRKVKQTITYRVPSWNFCNSDKTSRITSDTCRFCVKTRAGYICTLHDTHLESSNGAVSKAYQCRQLTAGFTVDEPPELPAVDPKFIMRETLATYKKTLNGLIGQGYPRTMAETIATKYVLEDTTV